MLEIMPTQMPFGWVAVGFQPVPEVILDDGLNPLNRECLLRYVEDALICLSWLCPLTHKVYET